MQPHAPSPAFLKDESLQSVNLWLGVNHTRSNIHFDSTHGLLGVVKGSKSVHLWPPDEAQIVAQSHPVGSSSSNHCTIRVHDTEGTLLTPEGFVEASSRKREGEGLDRSVNLKNWEAYL